MGKDQILRCKMKRESGVLLPIFSLPGPFGCGTFSRHAKDFIDRLAAGGFTLWQVLPFGICDSYHSPYMSLSSFGGNFFFIDPEILFEKGYVTKEELEAQKVDSPHACDYNALSRIRMPFLFRAAERMEKDKVNTFLANHPMFERVCRFLAEREGEGEEKAFLYAALQAQFHEQWDALHEYAQKRGISVIGDLPFYVSAESFDVWAHPSLFQLDKEGKPSKVAGVPPDYFSPEGQRWGNPLYDWDAMEKEDFAYFKARLSYQLSLFDGIRIDHFRAASAYFAIPAQCENGMEGEWIKGPGEKLVDAFSSVSKGKFLLAEDLGLIDSDTRDLLAYAGYPGMAVFQFGFDGNPMTPHLPHNYAENLVAYSGTHDNNTLLGFWFEAESEVRREALSYLGNPSDGVEGTIRALLRSRAGKVIFPLQDLLSFGSDTRINTPGKAEGNWQFRFTSDQIASFDAAKYAAMNRTYARGL